MTPKIMLPLRDELSARRARIADALQVAPGNTELRRLLTAVDAALERIEGRAHGLCEVCHALTEREPLLADPLMRFCVGHVLHEPETELEHDYSVATKIQVGLFPPREVLGAGWRAVYHHERVGPVNVDYCDLLDAGQNLYFVAGHTINMGVASSMLMAQLHASFRALMALQPSLQSIMERSSRMYCGSTLPSHFGTLVCGKANPSGEVELCNSGHLPVFLTRGSQVRTLNPTSGPVGLYYDERFAVKKVRLAPGDTMVVCTDGVAAARDEHATAYGIDRLAELLEEHHTAPPDRLLQHFREDLELYRGMARPVDDLTMMVLRKL